MNSTTVAIALLAAHFTGDWLLQTRTIAANKSKSWPILGFHVCIVGMALCAAFLCIGYPHTQVAGLKLLGYLVAHGIQDRYIWQFYEKYYHDPIFPDMKGKAFYNTIAIDQFIHLGLLMYLFL